MSNIRTTFNTTMTWLAIATICLGIIFITACGSTTSNISTVGNPDFELPTGKTAFYSPATNTTPVIQASTSESLSLISALTTDWTSGNPAYEVFNAFQSYTYPEDEGVIDVSNIYKLLFEAGTQYANALDTVEELKTATVITSPFDFGNEARTYDYASEHAALTQEGDVVYALLTWIWDEDPTFSYGVIEGNFNQTTGDLELDMVYLVDYVGDSDYCLRTYISGNETTHQFTLKAAKCGTTPGAYAISILGTGISQGENADDYFLLKIIDNDNLSGYPNGRYYKFAANATEADLMAHPVNGYDLTEIDDPNNYAETLDAMTFFALDGSDQATSVDDFTSSTLTLDF